MAIFTGISTSLYIGIIINQKGSFVNLFTKYDGRSLIVETPIPKAKRSGIGKLNNLAKRRVIKPRSDLSNLFPKLALEFP